MEITHDVTIDLLRPRQNVIRVVQEDSTRTIRLKLLSNNQNYNVANDLDEGETLLKFVEFRKADGHGGMYDTTSTGETAVELEDSNVPNVWLVNLDGQCFTAPGWTQINVRFETESGKRIHTFAIMVDVEPTASSDTESTDWGELNSIGDMKAAITTMFEETMSVEAKQALLNFLAHVAYADEHGQDYYDALEAELFRTAELVSISAVFDQGSATIYDTDDLETLRQYLTVTATYEDLSTREITGYTLSGTLTVGTSTITVSYGGKTATFDVVVSYIDPAYQQVEWIGASGTQYIDSGVIPGANAICEAEYESQKQAGEAFQTLFGTSWYTDLGGGTAAYYRYAASIYSANTTIRSDICEDSSATNNSLIASVTVPTATYVNQKLTYKMDEKNRVMYCGAYSANMDGPVQTFTRKYPLYVLANNRGSSTPNAFSVGKLYSIKLTDDTGLRFNLVPCYKKADGTIGVFDKVSKTFFTNAGTGVFTKGNDV